MEPVPEQSPTPPDDLGPEGAAGADGVVEVDGDDRTYQPMSLRGPALIVLGIAVLIVVVGVVASAVASGSSAPLSIHSVRIPDGTTVHLVPADRALHAIVSAGEPPADILNALAVPAHATVSRTVNIDQGAGQFDRTVEFRSGNLASGQVVDVYRTLLPKLGWKVIYVGSGAAHQAQGTEVLAKRGSGDSFYWEVGVVVSPTTSTGTTPFSVEVLELPDDN